MPGEGSERSERTVVDDVGPFRLARIIGQGGMGIVYEAERRTSGEKVALKTVRDATPTTLLALRSEIASLRSIRHPGIVRIIESGVNESGPNAGMPWYAMELIEGRTLRDFNRELWGAADDGESSSGTPTSQSPLDGGGATMGMMAALSHAQIPGRARVGRSGLRPRVAAGRLPEVLTFYKALCGPIAHLHSRGLTHRDLKPANVFIRNDGSPVLVDFGLVSHARGTIGRENLTANAPGLGTVGYVAPEQILGLFVDARADLYSIGCMLYESLTGQPPFENRGRETLDRHLGEKPVPVSEVVEGISPELDTLVASLLAKVPRDRLGYAADMASVLAKLDGIAATSIEAEYLYRPQIVGRQPALDRLAEHGARLASGKGGLVLLGGPSGLGKTFLLAEFARRERQRGRKVITGECVPVATSSGTMSEFSAGPLHPFRKVLRAIADECIQSDGAAKAERLLGSRADFLADYAPELLRFGAGASGTAKALPAVGARARVLESLVETLSAYSLEAPLLILLDDLQWADELTIGFLESLQSRLFETRPLLIVASYRAEEVGADLERLLQQNHVERVSLDRLDATAIQAIVGDMLGMRKAPASMISFLSARAEGNPFFVAEYLRLLVSESVLKRIDGRWQISPQAGGGSELEGLSVPRSLEGIVNRRLERIGAEARELVEAASVLGREFSVEALAAILRLDEDLVRTGLRDAKSRQVVEEIADDDYRFSHDKLRESAYAAGDREKLRELHARAARHLETSHAGAEVAGHYAELVRHYRETGDTSKTIEYLDKAGGDALSKSAHKEAVLFLREAIRAFGESSGRLDPLRIARWHRQISDGLQGLGQLHESAVHLKEAAALLHKPAPEMGWRLVVSLLRNVGRQALHRFLPKLFLGRRRASQDLAEAARIHDRLLQVMYFAGHPLEMLHACVSSLNLAEVAGDSLDLASAYSNAFAVTGIIPVRGLAESYRRRAFEMNDKRAATVIECYLRMQSGGYSIGVAAWARATSELARGQAVATELGYRRGWEDCGSIDAIGSYIRAGFDESIEKSVAVYHSALRGDAQTQAWGLIQQAYVLLVQDRLEEACSRLRTAEPLIGEDQKARLEYPWFHAVQARARLRRGEFTGALASARLALGRMKDGPPVYFAWIEALPAIMEVYLELLARGVARDDHEGLRAGARRTLAVMKAQAHIFPAALPQTLLWRGRLLRQLGARRAAERSWRRAIVGARALGMPLEEASAMRDLAQGDSVSPEDAHILLARSSEILRTIGATYDLAVQPSEPTARSRDTAARAP